MTIIVNGVHIMKIVGGRKGVFMRESVLKRMEEEVNRYRLELISGRMTAEQIVEQSYQFSVKQSLYYVFTNHNVSKLSADEWNWLDSQKHIINYLYELWMDNNVDLMDEFAEIIQNEMNLDMEVHKND